MGARRYIVIWSSAVALFAAAYVIAYVALIGSPISAEYWLREVRSVKQALARRATGPKLLALGGSNVLFGVDAGAIARHSGRPAINLGLHAGLPLHELLDIGERELAAGDTALVVLEFDRYGTDPEITRWYARQVLAWDGAAFERASLADRSRLVVGTPLDLVLDAATASLLEARILRSHPQRAGASDAEVLAAFERRLEWQTNMPIRSRTESIFDFRNLGAHGDIGRTDGQDRLADTDYGLSAPFVPAARSWAIIARFHDRCRARGARCVFAFPPIRAGTQVELRRAAIEAHLDAIEAHARSRGVQFLPRGKDAYFDAAYFFDSPYHLNARGRALRTAQLIAALDAGP